MHIDLVILVKMYLYLHGSKLQVKPFNMSEELKHCNSCLALISTTAKFCSNCGAEAEQFITLATNTCECGAELLLDAKFCTECGKKLTKEIPNTILCSCGTELMYNAKFCTDCGKQVNMKPEPVKAPKKKTKKKPNDYIDFIAVLLILLGATFYALFYNVGLKKTLLASYEILPNDSIETVITYKDEVMISIPPGALKQKDSLHLYSLGNLDIPECADAVLRTYDFDFEETQTFDQEVEVTFSYKNELAENKIVSGQSVYVMYYNEETKEWEDTNAIINKQNKSVRVSRSHFSSLGLVSVPSEPGPMMQAYSMIDSTATVPYPKALENFANMSKEKEPDQEAVKEGTGLFIKLFDISAHATDIHEKLLKYKMFEKFNKRAGLVSIAKSAVTLGIELGEGRHMDAIMNVAKTGIGIAAATAGIKIYVIYNVAVFLYDLQSERLSEEAKELEKLNYWADYYHYNANDNKYKRGIEEWSEFIAEKLDDIEFGWVLEQEVKRYVRAWFDEYNKELPKERTVKYTKDIPKEIKEALIAHESNRMSYVIKQAIEEYLKGVKESQEKAIIQYLFDMKKEMNSIFSISVFVVGGKVESKGVRNLPVTIEVEKDQELWTGTTDSGGQLYFKCTKLGYLTYSPKLVKVAYKDTVYEDSIRLNKHSGKPESVRIYIDEKEDEEEEDEEVIQAPSNYEKLAGEYTGLLYNYDYKPYNEYLVKMSKYMKEIDQSMNSASLIIDRNGNINATIVGYPGTEMEYTYIGSGAFGKANGNENFASFDVKLSEMEGGVYKKETAALYDKMLDVKTEVLFENGIMKISCHSKWLSSKGKLNAEAWAYFNATKK